ncbi:MAG: hypothetical protein JWM58_1802 [Rhizobium sp.]|nr:hypothetical protein [Rhizobium sp.]
MLLVTQALRDMHVWMVLLTVLAVSGIAWSLLLAAPPMAQTFVCGVDGVGPVTGAWSVDRLVALGGMWLAMNFAMMLPAAAVAMMRREGISALSFASGYLGVAGAISVAAAFGQWTLESLGVLGEGSRISDALLAGTLLAGIGTYHVLQLLRSDRTPCGGPGRQSRAGPSQGWRHGCSSIGCCVTMVGLQFVGGAMNASLMIALTLWMLIETALPWKRHFAASTGIALLTSGGLTIASAVT